MRKLEVSERPQSFGEEIANTVSHGLGLAAALIGASFLIVTAVQRDNPEFTAGASIFAATMVLLYLASTLYHAPLMKRVKHVLLVCDHSVIYLFIAGTYTPFTLGVLRGAWGWLLFGLVWGLAAAGVAFKVIVGAVRFPKFSTGIYLAMGWIFLIAALPLWQRLSLAGVSWILAGGLAYIYGWGGILSGK